MASSLDACGGGGGSTSISVGLLSSRVPSPERKKRAREKGDEGAGKRKMKTKGESFSRAINLCPFLSFSFLDGFLFEALFPRESGGATEAAELRGHEEEEASGERESESESKLERATQKKKKKGFDVRFFFKLFSSEDPSKLTLCFSLSLSLLSY